MSRDRPAPVRDDPPARVRQWGRRLRRAVAPVVALVAVGCGGEDPAPGGLQAVEAFFAPEVEEVTIEVDYQPGAEPFTSWGDGRDGEPWDLLQANVDALYAASPRPVLVPRELEEMEALPEVTGSRFTGDDLLAIAERHRSGVSDAQRRVVYIVFLDGYLEEDGVAQTNVLGVTVGNTGIVAMFKPVLTSGAFGRFVEQTTLIHEVGHVVGLVNNGLPLQSDHHDEENGAHCTNSSCVMFHLNEGALDVFDYVRRFQMTGDTVVFGAECIADAHAAAVR